MLNIEKKYNTYNLTATRLDKKFIQVKSLGKTLPYLIEGEQVKANTIPEHKLQEFKEYREQLVTGIEQGQKNPSVLTSFDIYIDDLLRQTMYKGMTLEEIEQHRANSRIAKNKKTVDYVKRVVRLNHTRHMKAVTLTYSDDTRPCYTDVERANKDYNEFMKRLRREYPNKNLEFVKVIETEEEKNIHMHAILFNLPYCSNDKLASIWGKGFVKIENIKNNLEATGNYITKGFEDYITKGLGDRPRELRGKRLMTMSNGLAKPKTSRQVIDKEKYSQFLIELNTIAQKYTKKHYEQVDYQNLCSTGELTTYEVEEFIIPLKEYRRLCSNFGLLAFNKETTQEEVTKSRKAKNLAMKLGKEIMNITRQERENEIRN